MSSAFSGVPAPVNEKPREYAPGSEERTSLQTELTRQRSQTIEIPLIIGGQPESARATRPIVCPHDHRAPLGIYHCGDARAATRAADAALEAGRDWQRTPWEDRVAIFLKAADLIAGRYRYVLNAATMLGQSKNVRQAEIDAACELVDYLRFNAFFMATIYDQQIRQKTSASWTLLEYRPLEGFVFAVTPFNFTAIGGNLPTAPAMMGNTVVWKPSGGAVLSAYYIMQILREAGLPDGVINFLPGSSRDLAPAILDRREFAGIHFTGSTAAFNGIWKQVGDNIGGGRYRTYPRLVGETGGKGFVIAHADADVDALSVALFRGAFEYQGQKCSAASRAYIPRSIWRAVRDELARMADEAVVGDVCDFRTFMGAVIDEASFDNIRTHLEHARASREAEIAIGGGLDRSRGYFVKPTVIVTSNPRSVTMEEEIFGPVLTVYVYEDGQFDDILRIADETSPYGLTGAVFARSRSVIRTAIRGLIHAAGNLTINDTPTGAQVGRQPFGGARMSGTNDKAGSGLNLLRWVSPRTIKESFSPPRDFAYPHMRA